MFMNGFTKNGVVSVELRRLYYRKYMKLYRRKNLVSIRLADRDWHRKHCKRKSVLRVCGICFKSLEGTKQMKYCVSCSVLGRRVSRREYSFRIGRYSRLPRGAGWTLQKYRAMARDGFRACCCGTGNNLVVHHVVDFKDSRDNSLDNLVTLCSKHHSSSHNSGVFYWK